jgi:hypothetical protein
MEQGSSSLVSEIASGPLTHISAHSDVITVARMSRGMPGMRNAIREDARFPFGSPCLLHSDPSSWPADRTEQVFIVFHGLQQNVCVLYFILENSKIRRVLTHR